MSRIEMSRCEVCKKTVEDRFGWVSLEGDHAISISISRDSNGQAKTRYLHHSGHTDFCSVKCFLKWLECKCDCHP